MKQIKLSICLLAVIVMVSNCKSKNESSNNDGVVIPELSWELKQNLSNDKGESLSVLTIKNTSDIDLPASGWKIYFNYILSFTVEQTSPFEIKHVNGDVRSLSPIAEFKGLKSGEQIEITLLGSGSVLSFTDAPIGFFIVYDENPGKGITCSFEMVDLPLTGLNRTANEILPVYTAEVTYEENLKISKLDVSEFCPIIPTPRWYKRKKGELKLSIQLR